MGKGLGRFLVVLERRDLGRNVATECRQAAGPAFLCHPLLLRGVVWPLRLGGHTAARRPRYAEPGVALPAEETGEAPPYKTNEI